MTELARSPRRIEHVRENSDKLFHDLFANSQKPLCDESGFPRVPWKDRNLPASFFRPPPPNDSQPPPTAAPLPLTICHGYSQSVPAINSRPMYPRQQPPAANLWGPSTLPEPGNNSVQQQNEFVQPDGLKEIRSLPQAAQDQYNMQNVYTPYESQQQQRSQYYQPPQQPPMNYQHISHSRQASLPYSHPRMAAAVNNHRYGNSLKQQQSKPSADWWPAQQSPQQTYHSQVSNTAATVGPACQHWSTAVPQQNQWQQQETTPDTSVYNTPAPASRPLPIISQSYPSNEWSNSANSWPATTPQQNVAPDVIVVSEQSSNPPQAPPVLDEQRQQLMFFAARLKEERDRMKAKIEELEKKLEDVMAALTVSNNVTPSSNGFYPNTNVSSNPDDLVPSLQIGDQGNSLIGPPQLENGNSPSSWM